MKEEEVLKLIMSSPDGAEAFNAWMKLQWATFWAEVSLLSVFILVLVGSAGYIIYRILHAE